MRVPTYTSPGQLQSNMRIPSTDTGGDMIGAAMSKFGGAVAGLGVDIQQGLEQQKKEQERIQVINENKAEFDGDTVLMDYKVATANTSEIASLQANPDGSNLHDIGIKNLETNSQSINSYIADLKARGYHYQAAQLENKKRQYDYTQSIELRKNEYIQGRKYQIDHLTKTGDGIIANTTVDPVFNDRELKQGFETIDAATHLSQAEKNEAKEKILLAALSREAELRTEGNPAKAAELLGYNRPDAPLKTRVAAAAQARGVPPAAAIAVAQMESSFNPEAVNPNTQYRGLFMLSPQNVAKYGGSDVEHGIAYIADAKDNFVQNVGREPTLGEYGMLQLAPNGTAVLVNMNPNTPISDGLAQAGLKNPATVIAQNPALFQGVSTVGQFRQNMETHMQQKLQEATGGGATMTSLQGTKAAGQLSQTPAELEPYKAKVSYQLGPKRPNKPQEYVVLNAAKAVTAVNPGYSIVVTSGGGEHGSDRHRAEHGYRAADIKILDENGVPLTYNRNPTAFKQALTNLAAAGFKGIGFYGPDNTMIHVDDVRVGQWGPSLSGDSLPQDVAAAIATGRGQNVASLPQWQSPAQGPADPRYNGLDLKTRDQIYTNALQAQEKANRTQAAQALENYNAYKGGLEMRMAEGMLLPSDIQQDPMLNAGDRADFMAKVAKQFEDVNAFTNAALTAQNTGTNINFDEKKVRDGENQVFNNTVVQPQGTWYGNPQAQQATYDFITKSGHAPERILSDMNNALYTQDYKNLGDMLQLIGDIKNPGLFRGHEKAGPMTEMLQNYNFYKDLGYSSELASKTVLDNHQKAQDPVWQKNREIIQNSDVWKKSIKDLKDPSYIKSQAMMNDKTVGDMVLDANFMSTWSAFTDEYLSKTQTLNASEAKNQAVAYANEKIKTIYQADEIEPGRTVVMRNHPRIFYTPIRDVKTTSLLSSETPSTLRWIDDQATADSKQMLTEMGMTAAFDMENLDVALVSDDITDAQATLWRESKAKGTSVPPPSYQLQVRDKYGVPFVIPGRFTPNEQAAFDSAKSTLKATEQAMRTGNAEGLPLQTPPIKLWEMRNQAYVDRAVKASETVPQTLPEAPLTAWERSVNERFLVPDMPEGSTANDIINETIRRRNLAAARPIPNFSGIGGASRGNSQSIDSPSVVQRPVSRPREQSADDIIRENTRRQNQMLREGRQ